MAERATIDEIATGSRLAAGKAVAFVLKGYPRLSETFIAQEILALERRGLDIRIVSLRHPTDPAIHPLHGDIHAPVTYLPEYLHDDHDLVRSALYAVWRRPGFTRALWIWLRDLFRDPTRNRIRRFGQALVLANELPPDVGWLHAHFLHTPASVTRYAALILGLPWSVSAHAKDIWTSPEWEKREKLADCRWAVTCTNTGADHLANLAPEPRRVDLVYHGLDLSRFPPPLLPPSLRNGGDADDPVTLLSVGRAVPKKGYDLLLNALALLPSDVHWRLVHVGGGALLPDLHRQAEELGISDRISWLGAQPHDIVLGCYREADLFVLACRVAADGDRDGLPNVLMEAQSQNLACVSTRVSAVPELIIDGETGVLVPPDNAGALADAVQHLIRAPTVRRRLGAAGMARVRTQFSFEDGIERLALLLGVECDEVLSCTSPSTRL
ncbi:MAG: glycosyltransferase family 4 protein [Rhodospirillales bacterium]|nr:glycosyltransferase family 4 protein [Rhodospirillales bacterium]